MLPEAIKPQSKGVKFFDEVINLVDGPVRSKKPKGTGVWDHHHNLKPPSTTAVTTMTVSGGGANSSGKAAPDLNRPRVNSLKNHAVAQSNSQSRNTDSKSWQKQQTRRIMIYKQASMESQSAGLMSPISNATNKSSRNRRNNNNLATAATILSPHVIQPSFKGTNNVFGTA